MGHYLDLIQEPAKTLVALVVVLILTICGMGADLLIRRKGSKKP
jgi:hypothetical protein